MRSLAEIGREQSALNNRMWHATTALERAEIIAEQDALQCEARKVVESTKDGRFYREGCFVPKCGRAVNDDLRPRDYSSERLDNELTVAKLARSLRRVSTDYLGFEDMRLLAYFYDEIPNEEIEAWDAEAHRTELLRRKAFGETACG